MNNNYNKNIHQQGFTHIILLAITAGVIVIIGSVGYVVYHHSQRINNAASTSVTQPVSSPTQSTVTTQPQPTPTQPSVQSTPVSTSTSTKKATESKQTPEVQTPESTSSSDKTSTSTGN